jgi:hypothetical protein
VYAELENLGRKNLVKYSQYYDCTSLPITSWAEEIINVISRYWRCENYLSDSTIFLVSYEHSSNNSYLVMIVAVQTEFHRILSE